MIYRNGFFFFVYRMENRKVLVKIDVYYIDIYVEKNVLYNRETVMSNIYRAQKYVFYNLEKKV